MVVPPWAWHEHANPTGQEAILFSIQDILIMKDMALYREEPYAENAGAVERREIGVPEQPAPQ